MSETNVIKQPEASPVVACSDWLADPKWLATLKAKRPKLRAGHKLICNTRTHKIAPIFTIEMWLKEQRRYLPLQLPDGTWRWDDEAQRDAILKQMSAAIG